MLGVMGNQVVFPENNQLPRDLFACGQMRQAVSLYHSNFQTRIDKRCRVKLWSNATRKSRYLDKICEQHHMEKMLFVQSCAGGYNVEDSILFNEGSNRGLFRTTYFNSYESYEESSRVGVSQVDSTFANIEQANVVGQKSGLIILNLTNMVLLKKIRL